MNTKSSLSLSAIGHVFQDKTSAAWFYFFDYNWSTYRSNQGYPNRDAAREALHKHMEEVSK